MANAASKLGAKAILRRLGVAFLLFACLWFLAWLGARLLIVSAPLEHADAIVVLSGSSTFIERTRRAAQLYNAGRFPKIILTNDNHQGGWSPSKQRNPYYYESAVSELRRQGVPESAIEVIHQPVDSTYAEAVLLRDYADSHELNSLLMVTSAYHSRRALRTCRRFLGRPGRKIGLEAVAPGFQTPQPATWWLHIKGWEMVPAEYIKLAYYELL